MAPVLPENLIRETSIRGFAAEQCFDGKKKCFDSAHLRPFRRCSEKDILAKWAQKAMFVSTCSIVRTEFSVGTIGIIWLIQIMNEATSANNQKFFSGLK